ncbi:TIGR04222 domain-containing membrane protein [Phytoactinopolyspora halophila]|uniref:TIGR04222 domain-containing membrane protein n=1 Tax=Phytoactinopolyspora halophila TaxID=1981511 RepID=UPI001314C6BC|nr:TIGR04222 domain-containing membrane protein [Phytoactinopolyspora halophila]
MTVTVLVPVIIGGVFVLLGLVYVLTGMRGRRMRARAAQGSALTVDDLDEHELALLAGGKRRLGQVVLARLYRDGRIRVRRAGRGIRKPLARVEAVGNDDGRGDTGLDHELDVAAMDVVARRPSCHPAVLVAAVGRSRWTQPALSRLRSAGLLLPAERLRGIERLHSLAVGIQSIMVFPLAAGILFSMMFLAASSASGGAPRLLTVPLFLATPLVLVLVLRFFGVAALVLLGTVFALVYLVAPELPDAVGAAGLAFCGAWLATYGVHLVTRRHLGPRTPAGDRLLDAARSRLEGSRRPGAASMPFVVALLGLANLRGWVYAKSSGKASSGHEVEPHWAGLCDFADACGQSSDLLSGTNGDGGPGGAFSSDGGDGSFASFGGFGDALGGGGVSGSGGPGGGDGGGDGGGG